MYIKEIPALFYIKRLEEKIMGQNIVLQLINNMALLMALSIVYELSYVLPSKLIKYASVIKGIIIGVIGVGIMSIPFTLTSGIVFDTRSILISVSALIFGMLPTVIASIITIIYRIILGGMGTLPGIATILSSAAIGLLVRKILNTRTVGFLKIYGFGFIVHIVMLLCMFLLPWPTSIEVIREISLPVLLIYPIGTVVLSMLLLRQKKQREIQKTINEYQSQYESLFKNNHAVMLIIRPTDGQIVNANPAAEQFYGWALEDLKKMNVNQINTLNDDEKLKKLMGDTINDISNHYHFKHKKASGELVDVEVYSGPIVIQGETLLYSIIHDESERMRYMNALEESEQQFRNLVEGAPESIFIHISGKFVFLNQYAVSLFGASSYKELLGKPVLERFHPDYHKAIKKRISASMRGETNPPHNETIALKLDGTPVFVEDTGIKITFEGKEGIIVFARDITERKKMEENIKQAEAQSRQQQKLESIGILAGGVAHEINNPINGIINYAQLILDETLPDTTASTYASEIIHESERISEIVKNLLEFSRFERQSHSYASIYDIIDHTVSLVRTIIKKDQIDLILDLEENLPMIKCRSQQIQQVIMNLLTNARDATNEKYPNVHPNKAIILSCKQFISNNRKWIRIIVEDRGKGIPNELHEKIFEPFFSTKPKDMGTGLGLSISFGIIKEHHGEIRIDSCENLYTKFIIDLPVDNGWELI